jgi:hypothetical protein
MLKEAVGEKNTREETTVGWSSSRRPTLPYSRTSIIYHHKGKKRGGVRVEVLGFLRGEEKKDSIHEISSKSAYVGSSGQGGS